MKKLSLAAIIAIISISLVGCTNSSQGNNAAGSGANNSNVQDNNTAGSDVNNSNLQGNNTTNISGKITLEKAKEIALKHAGLKSDEVSFVETESGMDNGIEKYDIEFYHNNKEYDYEINATNGEIIKYDYDIERDNTSNNNQSSNKNNSNDIVEISMDKAKGIALSHAGLTTSQVNFKKAQLDFDDGIQKYEIEFYYNNKEYNYEIDANTGKILSYEQD